MTVKEIFCIITSIGAIIMSGLSLTTYMRLYKKLQKTKNDHSTATYEYMQVHLLKENVLLLEAIYFMLVAILGQIVMLLVK